MSHQNERDRESGSNEKSELSQQDPFAAVDVERKGAARNTLHLDVKVPLDDCRHVVAGEQL